MFMHVPTHMLARERHHSPCLDYASQMLDDLKGCAHSQHYQEHQTWLEGQTICLQPNEEGKMGLSK